jgi:Icc-related predicted phosphoesterase
VTRDPRRLLAVADLRGRIDQLGHVLDMRDDLGFDAVALVGDLAGEHGAGDYQAAFEALGGAGVPAFWVPGPGDAPLQGYLRASHNMEVVYPNLEGIHGTIARRRHLVFAGMGGEILNDPATVRDEHSRLRYPGWEVEYRLKALRDVEERRKVLLFSTPPAHKGRGGEGSDVLAELVKTIRAQVVVTTGERRTEQLGRTLVVAPGSLADGDYAVIDLHGQARTLALAEP